MAYSTLFVGVVWKYMEIPKLKRMARHPHSRKFGERWSSASFRICAALMAALAVVV